MPMDGVMLGFVAEELRGRLIGGRLDRVVQPERDVLVLFIRSQGENEKLLLSASAQSARAHLTQITPASPAEPPAFCMLLRKQLTGGRVSAIDQLRGDRILAVRFAVRNELGDAVSRTLILEAMGRHSNLIFLNEKGQILDAARRIGETVSSVRLVLPGLPYELPPSQDKLDPYASDAGSAAQRFRLLPDESLKDRIFHTFSGFSPESSAEAAARISASPDAGRGDDPQKTADAFFRYIGSLHSLGRPVITQKTETGKPDVYPFPQVHLQQVPYTQYDSVSQALDAFFTEKDRADHLRQRTSDLAHLVRSRLERCQKKLAIQEEALASGAQLETYRRCGELLQANLHLLRKGMSEASVQDYYSEDGGFVAIEMDASLSPVQNAQRYFRLYRKARTAMELAEKQIESIRMDMLFLEQVSDDLRKAASEQDIAELRALLEDASVIRRSPGKKRKQKEAVSLPLRFCATDGTPIDVGKNAAQNERLTLGAKADETWLHVQKIPGSHVLIRGSAPSEQTVLEAAGLAVLYSKASQSQNVPVDVTLRRYIRKPPGTPVGFVTYTHQKTLYVTPDEGLVRRLTPLRP